jgi:hypothetical protein
MVSASEIQNFCRKQQCYGRHVCHGQIDGRHRAAWLSDETDGAIRESDAFRLIPSFLLLQMLLEKFAHPFVSVFGVGGAVAAFVVGVLEGVSGVGIDFHIDGLSQCFHS